MTLEELFSMTRLLVQKDGVDYEIESYNETTKVFTLVGMEEENKTQTTAFIEELEI